MQYCRISVVESLEGLNEYVDQWDRLALGAPQQLPLLSSAWVISFLENCLGAEAKWKCLFATMADGQLAGVLPLVIYPHRWLGSSISILRTPWDYHTRSGDALYLEGHEEYVFTAFWETLTELFGIRFWLEMRGVRGNSPTLLLPRKKNGYWVTIQKNDSPAGVIPIKGNIEEYNKLLTTKFRSNIRWAGKKLAQMSGFNVEVLNGRSATLDRLQQFFNIENSGWKGDNGTSINRNPKLISFYTRLAQSFSKRGWLEFHFLNVEGKVIAAHMAVKFGSSLVIPKIAYDENYARYSPGGVLFWKTIKRVYENGEIREINMLSDSKWFNNWKMEWYEHIYIRMFPAHIAPILLGYLPAILEYKLSKIKIFKKAYYKLMIYKKS